jgi:hypothetical protein
VPRSYRFSASADACRVALTDSEGVKHFGANRPSIAGGVPGLRFFELRKRESFGLALLAALLAGGGGFWVLRSKTIVVPAKSDGAGLIVAGDHASGSGESDETTPVSDLLRQILRTDARDSSIEDREVIWRLLKENYRAQSGAESVNWFEVDESLAWLRGARAEDPEIESGLIGIAADKSLLEQARCFALQHLGIWAEQNAVGATTVQQLRALAEDMQCRPVASAALRVLTRLRASSEDTQWLRDKIVRLLETSDCPSVQSVAALHIAVELGAAEVEPFARRLTAPGCQQAQRVNAFLALGCLGTRDTLRWIQSQPEPVEILVKEARQTALKALVGR